MLLALPLTVQHGFSLHVCDSYSSYSLSPPARDVSGAGWRKRPMESNGQDRRRAAKHPTDTTSLQNGGQPRTPQNKAATTTRPSEMLSHWHHRPSQTTSGTHLSIRRNTLITPQLLPACGYEHSKDKPPHWHMQKRDGTKTTPQVKQFQSLEALTDFFFNNLLK